MLRPLGVGDVPIVAKDSYLHIEGRGLEMGAVRIADATELYVGGNECADEAQVDEGNKQGRTPGGAQSKESG